MGDEYCTEIAPTADAIGLELLEPSSGRVLQKLRKVLDGKVII
jgi:hypothetical protein